MKLLCANRDTEAEPNSESHLESGTRDGREHAGVRADRSGEDGVRVALHAARDWEARQPDRRPHRCRRVQDRVHRSDALACSRNDWQLFRCMLSSFLQFNHSFIHSHYLSTFVGF